MTSANDPDQTPIIVGRASERETLREHLARAAGGSGSLILLGGETGIGKTALVDDLTVKAANGGIVTRSGRCYDVRTTPAYGPWVEAGLLRVDWGNTTDLTPERKRILDAVREIGPARPADIAVRLGITPNNASQSLRRMLQQNLIVRTGYGYYHVTADGGASQSSQTPSDIAGGNDHATLLDQVTSSLRSLANRKSMLVALEDMHWADPSSVELLRSLSHQLAELPILVIATYRTDEPVEGQAFYRLLPALARESPTIHIELNRLTSDAVSELVSMRYELSGAAAERLTTYLDRQTDGNPFFISEILHSLEVEQRLRFSEGQWALGDLKGLSTPLLLRQVVDNRVDALGEESMDVLVTAAVIGPEVPFDLWQAVSGVDVEQLSDIVARAVSASILEELPDTNRFRFRHALVRQALYERLILPQRRTRHREIAEVLASLSTPDPDAVAHHFQQAHDSRAIQWLVESGRRAQRTAWLTAADRYEAALEMANDATTDASERGWLLIRIAQLRRFVDPAASSDSIDQLLQISDEIDDPVLAAIIMFYRGERRYLAGEVHNGIAEQEQGVRALDELSEADNRRYRELVESGFWPDEMTPHASLVGRLAQLGHFARSQEIATRALDAAGSLPTAVPANSPVVHFGSHIYSAIAHAYVGYGQPERARKAFARARAGFRAAHNQAMIGSVSQMELISVLHAYYTDDLAERERVANEVTEIWDTLGGVQQVEWTPRMKNLPYLILEGNWGDARRIALALRALRDRPVQQQATLHSHLGPLAREQGDTALAWSSIRETMPGGPETEPGSLRFYAALSLQWLAAQLALDEHDLSTAGSWLNARERWLEWNEAVLGPAESTVIWARYHWINGDRARAIDRATKAVSQASSPRQPLALMAAHRFLGELLTREERFQEAEEHINQSLNLATACGAPYERARSLVAQAELQKATWQNAEPALAEAHGICAPLGAQPLLARIETLRSQRAAPASPQRTGGVLSEREHEVLQLVAEGMTDGQVADQLFISPRTVSHHLRSIYNKLDVPSRAAAVRRAIESDWV